MTAPRPEARLSCLHGASASSVFSGGGENPLYAAANALDDNAATVFLSGAVWEGQVIYKREGDLLFSLVLARWGELILVHFFGGGGRDP